MNEFSFQELLKLLIQVVLLPAIPVIVTYVVKTLKTHIESKIAQVNNSDIALYLNQVCDIISQAVTYTTQTYVDTLKAEGKFDEEAQKTAFQKTKDAVITMISKEAYDLLNSLYDDTSVWLETKIEQEVKLQKTTI